MEQFSELEEAEGDCITCHPGFEDACLNQYILETAALGLKTRAWKSHRTLFVQGQKSEAE